MLVFFFSNTIPSTSFNLQHLAFAFKGSGGYAEQGGKKKCTDHPRLRCSDSHIHHITFSSNHQFIESFVPRAQRNKTGYANTKLVMNDVAQPVSQAWVVGRPGRVAAILWQQEVPLFSRGVQKSVRLKTACFTSGPKIRYSCSWINRLMITMHKRDNRVQDGTGRRKRKAGDGN